MDDYFKTNEILDRIERIEDELDIDRDERNTFTINATTWNADASGIYHENDVWRFDEGDYVVISTEEPDGSSWKITDRQSIPDNTAGEWDEGTAGVTAQTQSQTRYWTSIWSRSRTSLMQRHQFWTNCERCSTRRGTTFA
jgi:hypothetical protein